MTPLTGDELLTLYAEIFRKIDSDPQRIATPERTEAWRKGWHEALERFRADPREESLVPVFIRPSAVVRFQQKFCRPSSDDYELWFYRRVQEDIGDWMVDAPTVYEFGCGTGFNLVALAKRFPMKRMIGFDFVTPAVELVHEAGIALGVNVMAGHFDMLRPDPIERLQPGSGVFTFGAVEQLGQAYGAFFEYLIAQRPQVVVHIEPVIEFYDPMNEVDATAVRFHKKRGYAEGWWPMLSRDERLEILESKRYYFGSLMHEGYSMIVWRPK